jgi:NAD(P)-dependent dehydrogenase (short-subunit alcohol dehydrogenase family)
MNLLEGKNAVITGSTRGIGKAIAVEFARYGARVLLNHRSAARGADGRNPVRAVIEQIRQLSGYTPKVIEADMTREDDVAHLSQAALGEFERIDIWVNNVGLHLVTPALQLRAEQWENLVRINLTSSFLGSRAAAVAMKDRGGGRIINVTSKMGIVGCADNSCYCAAKAAVKMMSECLAAEWASFGIQVNAIAPGVTLTDPTFKVIRGQPELEAALCYRTPLGRMAEPDEIGKAAVFLASDLASYVTGTTLSCDGGWVGDSDFAGIPPEKLESWNREFPKNA